MFCIDCEHVRYLNNLKGEVDLTCTKYKKVVCAYDKCHYSKEYAKEKRITDIYLDNYKTKSLTEIAKMTGLKNVDILKYFIQKHYLPRKRDKGVE